jgi:hypothetical protein
VHGERAYRLGASLARPWYNCRKMMMEVSFLWNTGLTAAATNRESRHVSEGHASVAVPATGRGRRRMRTLSDSIRELTIRALRFPTGERQADATTIDCTPPPYTSVRLPEGSRCFKPALSDALVLLPLPTPRSFFRKHSHHGWCREDLEKLGRSHLWLVNNQAARRPSRSTRALDALLSIDACYCS